MVFYLDLLATLLLMLTFMKDAYVSADPPLNNLDKTGHVNEYFLHRSPLAYDHGHLRHLDSEQNHAIEIQPQVSNIDQLEQYDENEAIIAVAYATVASCLELDLIRTWTCKMCTNGVFPIPAPPPLALDTITVITEPSEKGHAVIGVDPVRNRVVVSFQGTINAGQTWEDLNIFPEDKYCDGCEVNAGFLNVWETIDQQVIDAVLATGKTEVLLTGHSLGAAVAVHAAVELAQRGLSVRGYTFGQPRMGNNVFSGYFSGLANVKAWWRIVNYKDPIPALVPKGDSHVHTATEVWYHQEPNVGQVPGNYKVFSTANTEDPNGQLSVCNILNIFKLCFNGDYHNTYMNLPAMGGTDYVC